MQRFIQRTTKNILKQNLLKVSPVLTQIHCAQVKICNIPKYTFCYNNNQNNNFDRVSNYESLISRISSSSSIEEVLKVFAVNEQLMKNEHIVLSLRMMARLLRNTNQNDQESIFNDDRYKQLTQRAAQSIESLNEYEALDFLFWMRKFRVARIQLNINNEDLEKFYGKIGEFLRSKSFNFRNLVNLYYDYSFINRTSQEICLEILRELRSDNKLLTPFTVIQILQAASRKTAYRQTQELMLAHYVTNNFQALLDEFDTDQKCVLFKYLSVLEMNYNPPRFRLPHVIYTLRNQLKDKLDQLSEASVINIVNAYQYLPKEFPIDLLEEIKDMVVITIQHNSQNIKTFFLLDFIESVQRLKRKRLDDKKIEILAEELSSRILHDEFLQKPRNLERLVNIYDNGLRHPSLLNGITEFLKQYDKKQIQMSIYEFLARRKVDMDDFISHLISNYEFQSIGTYNQVRLFILLNFLQQPEKYQTSIDKLKQESDKIVANEPGRFINILKNSTIYGTTRKEYMDIAIQNIQKEFLEVNGKMQQQEISNFFKNVFNSIELKEQKNQWIDWFVENQAVFSEHQISRAIDVFFQLEEPGVDQFLLFFNILQLDNQSKLSFTKLLFTLKDSKNFTQNLIRYENLFKRFLQIMMQACTDKPQQIRLQYVFAFAQRVQALGYTSELYRRFLKKIFESHKASGKSEASNQIEFMYGMMLVENNSLQSKYAQELYDKNESNIRDLNIKAKFYSYVLLNANTDYIDSKNDYTKQLLDQLAQNFGAQNPQRILQSLAIYLSYPSQYVQENKDLLLKTLKDQLGQGNEKTLVQLIFALNQKYVRSQYELYFPFIKEIINGYNQFRKRLPIGVIIDILFKFVSINCKYPTIYNYILEDIGNNFNQISVEQRIRSLEAFGSLQIKQNDFFEINLQKILENSQQYRGYLLTILQSVYRIGLDCDKCSALIQQIFEQLHKNENYDELYSFVRYLPIMKLENEAEVLKGIMEKLPSEPTKIHEKYRNKGEIVLLSEFFATHYSENPEYQQQIKLFLGENGKQYDEIRNVFFKEPNEAQTNNIKLIQEYLNVMNVESELNKEYNGIYADIVIPDQKIMIKIVQARDCNFDRSSFNGKTLLLQRILEKLEPTYKVILVNNIEFRSTQDDESKINLLQGLGIESKTQDGQFDFSKVDKSLLKRNPNANNQKSNKKQQNNESVEE